MNNIRTLGGLTLTQLNNAFARLSGVQAVVSADGALVAGSHNPVDATSGNRTVTLADAPSAGLMVAVSKKDSTANTVTVSVAHLRDGGAGTITLEGQYEALLLTSKADGTWWPIGDHKTKAYFTATYGPVVGSDNWLKAWGSNIDALIRAATITRDTNGAATGAGVIWPDGTTGTYTGTASTGFPGAIDSYTVTYAGGTTKTVTQPTMTRDTNGAVIVRPALTVA